MFLKQANNKLLDLSKSAKFIEHYNSQSSFANIVLKQINNGIYNDFVKGLTEESVLLDLGGNIGLFSMFFSPVVKKIISVEPTPSHLEVFSDLLSIANISNIDIVNGAVCISNQDVTFNLGFSNTTMNSIVKHDLEHKQSITVKGYTLEKILENTSVVDFCKMDIEGYENILLKDQNIINTISSKIRKIFIEFHCFDNNSYEFHIKNALAALNSVGFECSLLSHDSVLAVKK